MGQHTKKSEYRMRVFKLPDNSLQMVFGCDAAPLDGKLLVDQDIVELVVATDHVEGPPPPGLPPAA